MILNVCVLSDFLFNDKQYRSYQRSSQAIFCKFVITSLIDLYDFTNLNSFQSHLQPARKEKKENVRLLQSDTTSSKVAVMTLFVLYINLCTPPPPPPPLGCGYIVFHPVLWCLFLFIFSCFFFFFFFFLFCLTLTSPHLG